MTKGPSHDIKIGMRWSTTMPVLQEHKNGGNVHLVENPWEWIPKGTKMPETPEEEQKIIAGQDIRVASSHFEENRIPHRPEFRAMMTHVLNEILDLPETPKCLDIGSGASGEMVREFMPEELRPCFIQTDINPDAVRHNRARGGMAVLEASYHDLSQLPDAGKYDLVTGLSTLDSTIFPEGVIEEIRNALKIGGYFVHMQDVLPSPEVVMHIADSQLKGGFRMYQADPVEKMVLMVERKIKSSNDAELMQGWLNDMQNLEPTPLAKIPYGIPVDAIDVLRDQLDRSVANTPGMDMLFNNWISAYREFDGNEEVPVAELDKRLKKMLKMPMNSQTATAIGNLIAERNKHLRHYWGNSRVNITNPHFQFKDRFGASAVVTVAQKVA